MVCALMWYASACIFELHHIVLSTVLWKAAIAGHSLVKWPLLPDCWLSAARRVLLGGVTRRERSGDLNPFRQR